MSIPPAKLARRIAGEFRWFAGLAYRVFQVADAIEKAAATIEKQGAEIETLKQELQELKAQNAVQTARLESIAVRAAADVTGDLSRRIGFLEGRSSRE